jgi:hypothetical protein
MINGRMFGVEDSPVLCLGYSKSVTIVRPGWVFVAKMFRQARYGALHTGSRWLRCWGRAPDAPKER